MTSVLSGVSRRLLLALCVYQATACALAQAQAPSPALHSVFPLGGRAGSTVTISASGIALDGAYDIRSSIPGASAKKAEGNQFSLAIPASTLPGIYDVRVVGRLGMSSPRAFVVGNRAEFVEKEPNDTFEAPQQAPLDAVVNGRIDKPGDVDCYRFDAKMGQRVVLECWARRIDSQLRAVLEVYDAAGKRLAVNRGYAGIDPLIDFHVPADGSYIVKLFDLSYLGGANHFYRLDIDTQARPEFAFPCVVERNKPAKVKLFGRNLLPPGISGKGSTSFPGLDSVEVEVTPPRLDQQFFPPLPLRPAQIAVDGFAYHYPGGHAPVTISRTDVPVIVAQSGHGQPEHPQEIRVPCEINGQLGEGEGDSRHWFALQAQRGDVLWLEAFGERIGSPIELSVAVLDASGRRELAKLPECLENPGQARFPTAHTDPAGRWVAPADGRYLIVVRDRIGGSNHDPRRLYRLSVRREEPEFHLAVVSRRTDQASALNVPVGGRELAEVIAIRRRGLVGPIRVSALNLPSGIQCPDVWIGPSQDRAPIVVSATRDCPAYAGALNLIGHANFGGNDITRRALGGTLVWPGQSIPLARITHNVALATAAEAGAVLTASMREGTIFQEEVIDVAFEIEQRSEGTLGLVHVSAIGLPRQVNNALVTLPAGKTKGAISFYLPELLAQGTYSFALQAEAELQSAKGPKAGSGSKTNVKLVSNPITIDVHPARISLEVDPRTPRTIGRGKIIQLQYTATRKNGFIGKIHTELVAPAGVSGLQSRGVTFTGQTEAGSIQVLAAENAPLGKQVFLRLEAVGTVEDQPIYHASKFVELEITE